MRQWMDERLQIGVTEGDCAEWKIGTGAQSKGSNETEADERSVTG